MKKLLSLFLSIVMVLSALVPMTSVFAETELGKGTTTGTYGNLTYTVETDGNITITGTVEAPDGEVTIPATIDSKAVTSIGDNAFAMAENLSSIVLPDSVKTIGKKAFDSCFSLSTINLNKVEAIGEGAFSYSGMSSINITSYVRTIGAEAFNNSFLETVTFEEGVTTIGSKARLSAPFFKRLYTSSA